MATLVGALFCLGIGRLIDRVGSRIVLTALTARSGRRAGDERRDRVWRSLVLVTLTRGLGQSALSVVSLAMVGKWFTRRLTPRWASTRSS